MDYESIGIWALIVGAIAAFVWLMRNLPWSHTSEGKMIAAQVRLGNPGVDDVWPERQGGHDPLFEAALQGDVQAQRACGMRDD